MAEDGLNQTNQATNKALMPEGCDVVVDTTSQIFMVFLYSVTCVLSTCGNFGVIRVVAHIEALQTFSNFFLLSLATADLVIGLAMNPIYIVFVTVVEATPFWVVKMEQFVWIATVAASTLSLSAVSIDRYIAITSPLLYPQLMNGKRCLGAILSIWFFSFAFASLRFALHDFEQLRKLWITTSVVTVFIPVTIIAFCYFHIFKVVRIQTRSIRECSCVHEEDHNNDSTSSQRMEAKKNRKAAMTVAIIIGLFLLMFLPSVVIFIMLLVVNDPCLEMKLNIAWLWAAGVSFAHSAINPWVYALRSSEFRKALKAVFSCREYISVPVSADGQFGVLNAPHSHASFP